MPRESLQDKKLRARKIFQRLHKAYPNAGLQLNYEEPMQLLAAVILSAQATDAQVNKVTEKLFKKYKTIDDFADADIRTFRTEIKSINYYNSKGKYIVESARKIRDDYESKIPNDLSELTELPGVARKTGTIVQYELYGKAEGIPVDTHVKRVAKKLKLSNGKTTRKIEKDLMKLYHKENWGEIAYYFQAYGRTVMKARGKAERPDPLIGLH
ncbi:MAG: endonuclease III [Candidatus Spechtbacterales bacterium]|nr:endonuclease III [Candidatus Spechtbacterales bacterium]